MILQYVLIYDKIYTMGEWENIQDFNKNKILNQKIKIMFYDIEQSTDFSLKLLLYESLKHLFTKERILIDNNSEIKLQNNEYLIENYDVILCNPFFNKTLKENSIFNITCLRDPVDRLINHYHYYDIQKYGYQNLIEFKNNNFNDFQRYCYVIGNLQFAKLSGFYHQTNDCAFDFINFSINSYDIKNVVYKNICQFDVVYIFENQQTHVNVARTNEYEYSEDFLHYLKSFCKCDYFIYDKFKHTNAEANNNNLKYIINYFNKEECSLITPHKPCL